MLYISVDMRYISVDMLYISVDMFYISVDMIYISVDMIYISHDMLYDLYEINPDVGRSVTIAQLFRPGARGTGGRVEESHATCEQCMGGAGVLDLAPLGAGSSMRRK